MLRAIVKIVFKYYVADVLLYDDDDGLDLGCSLMEG